MKTQWKVVLGLALVLPMGLFVIGSLMASAADQPARRQPIVIEAPASTPPAPGDPATSGPFPPEPGPTLTPAPTPVAPPAPAPQQPTAPTAPEPPVTAAPTTPSSPVSPEPPPATSREGDRTDDSGGGAQGGTREPAPDRGRSDVEVVTPEPGDVREDDDDGDDDGDDGGEADDEDDDDEDDGADDGDDD